MYGQTGAGKTHTMEAVARLALEQLFTAAVAGNAGADLHAAASADDVMANLADAVPHCEAGQQPSSCAAEVSITISAIELYNETLRCLLSGRSGLVLRSSPAGGAGVVVDGAEERVRMRGAGQCSVLCTSLHAVQQYTPWQKHCIWLGWARAGRNKPTGGTQGH